MFLNEGDKLLVSHRRKFNHEETRYFLGTVAAYEDGLVKVDGYTFVRDTAGGGVIRKQDRRTKIIPLNSGSVIVYELDRETDLEATVFDFCEGELSLTDGHELNMNMSELAHAGHI